MLTLPHPKHDEGGVLFCQSGSKIYELQSVQPRKYGSWFLDQRISSDSTYLMASKFDPKFLLLPFLEKSTRYSPLDQIVTYVEGCDRIPLQFHAEWGLGDVCDINDQLGDDMILYRLNADKTLAWLCTKVNNTAHFFCKKRMKALATQVSTFNVGAQSSQGKIVKDSDTNNDDIVVGMEDKIEALSIICDLLSEDLTDRLLASYKVHKDSILKPSASSALKRKADWETALEVEKETMSYNSVASRDSTNKCSNTNGNGANSAKKKPAVSSAKKVAPVVKGAGSIMSFFGKKK